MDNEAAGEGSKWVLGLAGCVGSQLGPAAGEAAACDSLLRPPEVVVPDGVEPHRQQGAKESCARTIRRDARNREQRG